MQRALFCERLILSNTIHDLDVDQLDALIARLNEAKEFSLTLTKEDIDLLLGAISTLFTLQSSLASNSVTINKLRKLLGIVVSSEDLSNLLGADAESTETPPRDENKSRKPTENDTKPRYRVEPKVVHHPLVEVKKGSRCPCCEIGTISKQAPTELLRITGHSPYSAVNHVQERGRCNACGEYFKAPLPEDVLADGGENQKYGYTARSFMVLSKYFMGAPFYRQQSLQASLGVPIAASTVFDQCAKVAEDATPVFEALIGLAANAVHFHTDDTSHHILDQKEVLKPQRKTQKLEKRTGTFASGLIATTQCGHDIVLFQTNIGHAGEWLDQVLLTRDMSLPKPLLMSDALSRNRPSLVVAIETLCNTHARREYVDVLAHFRQEVSEILHLYKLIWINEHFTCTEKMSKGDRLAYHRTHSLPVMEQIRSWGQSKLAEGVETNSGLGKAIQYFLNHYTGLIGFCTHEGAKLDNNRMEAQLKLIVRGRKNFSFYKTQAGALVSDVATSLIATCVCADENPFEYLTALQRYSARVKADPGGWLPWNYRVNL